MRGELYPMLRRLGLFLLIGPGFIPLWYFSIFHHFYDQSTRIDERHIPGYIMKVL